MKLLYCEDCGDMIAPFRENLLPRWCVCHRHAVWWVDGSKGIVRVFDHQQKQTENRRVWLLGVHNGLLEWEGGYGTSRDMVEEILDATPDTYLFKTCNSLVVRFRPGSTSDSAYATSLPQ